MKAAVSRIFELRWGLAALVYGVIFLIILVSACTGNLPAQLNVIPFYDKIGHVVLYCIATYLGHRLLNRRKIRIWKIKVPLWVLIFGSFTYVEEGLQFFSPNRSLDWIDLVASSIGLFLGYWLAERKE